MQSYLRLAMVVLRVIWNASSLAIWIIEAFFWVSPTCCERPCLAADHMKHLSLEHKRKHKPSM